MEPSCKSQHTTQLDSGNNTSLDSTNPFVFLRDMWEKLTSLQHNAKEHIAFIDTLNNSGLLTSLLDLLVQCDSEIIATVLKSCIRNIAECKESKYAKIMIDHTNSLCSKLLSPTYGTFCLLDAVSWCNISIRHHIINEDTLKYVLANINIKNLQNQNKSAVKLATVQSRILFVLMHLEFSVGRHFIAKHLDNITAKLNHFLNIQNNEIAENTLNCFKKYIFANKQIPQQSMVKISNYLATINNIDVMKLYLKGIENFICNETRVTTFEYLENTVDLFIKCKLWRNLSIAFNVFKNDENCVLAVCNIIEKCMEYVNKDVAEYLVHLMIESNLIYNIMKVLNNKGHFKFLWEIMNTANDCDAWCMIICMDIIPYLCNKEMYLNMIKNIQKMNKQKPWINQDTAFDMQCVMYQVFRRILKFDEMYKKLNNDDNVCTKLMLKYGVIDLMQTIMKQIEENNEQSEGIAGRKSAALESYDFRLKQLMEENKSLESESLDILNESNAKMIVSFIIRKFNENATQEIPMCITNLIEQFYLMKCDFVVPYLSLQLDLNGNIIINGNKMCAFCQNVGMSMRRCSGCKYVYYCNRMCQRKDWKTNHQSKCVTIKKLKSI